MKANIKETMKSSVWQHISFILTALMFLNTAICYCGIFFESEWCSFKSNVGEMLFTLCNNFRFLITDMFLMDLSPSVEMQQRNYIIQATVFFVSIILIFVALGLYKSWGKPVAIGLIVLISINIIVSMILIFVPYLLITIALQLFLIVALGMTIRHMNKNAKKKASEC